MRLTLSQLANIVQGKVFLDNVTFNSVTTDTRKITPGCLFIALKGKYFDAHDFADTAKSLGASAILVNRKLNVHLPQLVVQDTVLALSKMAAWVRQNVPTHVIALTGSSGKTSVKEMTASILKRCGNTLYTQDNLNNIIGVSITLLRLTQEYKYAVIELSANHHGEIAWSTKLTHPEVALVNNLAAAHLEGFGSLSGVARAKGEIYTGLTEDGIAILNADSNDWINWRTIIGKRKTWRFSLNNVDSEFTAKNVHLTSQYTEFTLQTPAGSIDVLVPLIGYHNISNALASSALSMAVGAPLTAIKAGLAGVKAIPGRLFPIPLNQHQLILDDSYNANVGSMITAIQVLSKISGFRIMVVGDIDELGSTSEYLHIHIGKIANQYRLDCVLSIGKLSLKISQYSGVGKHFIDKNTLISYLKLLLNQHHVVTILVKGSRSAAMEDIVHSLQEMYTC